MRDSININNFDFKSLPQQLSNCSSKRHLQNKSRVSPVKPQPKKLGPNTLINPIPVPIYRAREQSEMTNNINVNRVHPLDRRIQTILQTQAINYNKERLIHKDSIHRKMNSSTMLSQSSGHAFNHKRGMKFLQKSSLNDECLSQQIERQLTSMESKVGSREDGINDPQKESREQIAQQDLQIKQQLSSVNLLKTSKVMFTSNRKPPQLCLQRMQSTQIPNKIKIKKSRVCTLPKLKTQSQQTIHKSPKKQRALLSSLHQDFNGIKAQSYVVMERQSQQIIVGDKLKTSLQIASLTKIMTFYVVSKIIKSENINFKEEKYVVDEDIEGFPGTSAELYYGERLTIQNLIYGLMLPSGNDAAMCLARWGGGYLRKNGEKKSKMKFFIEEMNNCARELGLEGTKFGNPHGLPHADSRSTVFDVGKLCCVCLSDGFFKQVVRTRSYKCKIDNVKSKKKLVKCWQNTNKLLRRKNFIGIKTGITVTAGPCLASAYTFRDKIYVVIVAKCNKVSRRFKETRYLLFNSLKQLYIGKMNQAEQKTLRILYKTNVDIDSDYSEQEREFNYKASSKAEYKRRVNIICQQT